MRHLSDDTAFCSLSVYFCSLLSIFFPLLSLSQLSEELKQHLSKTMTENYAQPGKESITQSVDRLQQDVRNSKSQPFIFLD